MCSKPMQFRQIQPRVFYHRCFDHGVWAHLTLFKGLKSAEHIYQGLIEARRSIVTTTDKPLACPNCKRQMIVTPLKQGSSLMVDQCVPCNGIWFDVGELENVDNKGDLEKEFPHAKMRSDRLGIDVAYSQNKPVLEEAIQPTTFHPLMLLGLPIEEDKEGVAVFPVATFLLIFSCVLFSAKGFANPEYFNSHLFSPGDPFAHSGTKLLVSALMHASWMHLLGNMYFLFLVGDNIEQVDGPLTLLAIFWISVFAGDFAYIWSGGQLPALGASGGIAGLLVYYLLMFSRNRLRMSIWYFSRPYIISVSASAFMVYWVLFQIFGSLLQANGFASNIGYVAHLGGALVGFLFYLLRDP